MVLLSRVFFSRPGCSCDSVWPSTPDPAQSEARACPEASRRETGRLPSISRSSYPKIPRKARSGIGMRHWMRRRQDPTQSSLRSDRTRMLEAVVRQTEGAAYVARNSKRRRELIQSPVVRASAPRARRAPTRLSSAVFSCNTAAFAWSLGHLATAASCSPATADKGRTRSRAGPAPRTTSRTKSPTRVQVRDAPLAVLLRVVRVGDAPGAIAACKTAPTVPPTVQWAHRYSGCIGVEMKGVSPRRARSLRLAVTGARSVGVLRVKDRDQRIGDRIAGVLGTIASSLKDRLQAATAAADEEVAKDGRLTKPARTDLPPTDAQCESPGRCHRRLRGTGSHPGPA